MSVVDIDAELARIRRERQQREGKTREFSPPLASRLLSNGQPWTLPLFTDSPARSCGQSSRTVKRTRPLSFSRY